MNGAWPSRPDTRHRLRLVRLLIALLAAVAAIAAMECIVFNLPFWRTLGASTDTNAVHNTLGSGLTRRNDGMLTVTDPTKAYLELTADGTSDYLRIDTASSKVIDKAREQAEALNPKRTTIRKSSNRWRPFMCARMSMASPARPSR